MSAPPAVTAPSNNSAFPRSSMSTIDSFERPFAYLLPQLAVFATAFTEQRLLPLKEHIARFDGGNYRGERFAHSC